jgi:hypothetical protein
MNDFERQQWIENDEGLYNIYLDFRNHHYDEKKNIRIFIKCNRNLIDDIVYDIGTLRINKYIRKCGRK